MAVLGTRRVGPVDGCLRRIPHLDLTVSSLNVHFRLRMLGLQKYLGGGPLFDQFSQEHEDTMITDAAGLRHVVGDNQDRVLFAQVRQQFLDVLRALGIQAPSRVRP